LHSGGVFGRNDAGEILGGCGRQIVRCPAGRRAIAAQSHLKGWRWIVDARKRNGCRYIVESAEVLSAFLELEATLLLTGRFYWVCFAVDIVANLAGRIFTFLGKTHCR
jgi:hypothetical protein